MPLSKPGENSSPILCITCLCDKENEGLVVHVSQWGHQEKKWSELCKGHQIHLCLSFSLYIQPLLAVNAPWVIKGQNSSREVLNVFHEFWLWLSMCLLSTCLEIYLFINHCLSAAWRFWSLSQSCWNDSCFSLLYFNNACWTLLVVFFFSPFHLILLLLNLTCMFLPSLFLCVPFPLQTTKEKLN